MIRCAVAVEFAAVSCSYSMVADSSTREAEERLCSWHRNVVELRSQPSHNVTLVRPDGYIAFSAHSRHEIAELSSVQSLLEYQINQGAEMLLLSQNSRFSSVIS
jgi:hypothetical protein